MEQTTANVLTRTGCGEVGLTWSSFPLGVGLEHLTQHISTQNAASLWDKLTSTPAASP